MANQEHLEILKQGVEVWNKWREEHPEIHPDLGEVDLSGTILNEIVSNNSISISLRTVTTHLRGINLQGANLSDANLRRVDFRNANLRKADLISADLSGANLSFANLKSAKLFGADCRRTNFFNVNLRGVDLQIANLSEANLEEADMSYAHIGSTIFGDVDLSMVKGLDVVRHHGFSIIGVATIYLSEGNIPEAFLRGTGVPDSFIEYMRSLIDTAIDYYTCFISYSSKDGAFAKRLHADLQQNGVRCWFAPHDMRPGTVILRGIDEAIRLYDKLLLILSEHSIASNWVEHEVEMALFKEMDRKQDVLFPIRLDNAVLESPTGWATRLRHRHISDFTHWKHHDDYQKAFERLLRDLKAAS